MSPLQWEQEAYRDLRKGGVSCPPPSTPSWRVTQTQFQYYHDDNDDDNDDWWWWWSSSSSLPWLLNSKLTPWSSILLEKLIVTHLVKSSPAFYGTRKFVTSLDTIVSQLIPVHNLTPFFKHPLRFFFLSAPASLKWSLPFRCSEQNFVCISHVPHASYMLRHEFTLSDITKHWIRYEQN